MNVIKSSEVIMVTDLWLQDYAYKTSRLFFPCLTVLNWY